MSFITINLEGKFYFYSNHIAFFPPFLIILNCLIMQLYDFVMSGCLCKTLCFGCQFYDGANVN